MEQSQLVLLTGASGFLAGHVLQQLLKAGYRVRGTVRSLKNKERIQHIYDICPEFKDKLELVEADLLKQEGWEDILKDCDFVVHTASPFPNTVPKDPKEIITPAVAGTEVVMKAAIKNGVKKLVLTSSIAAISTAQKKNFFQEQDWSNVDLSPPYEASKHLAEKKAWEIYNENKKACAGNNSMEMTIINPGVIMGPNNSKNQFTSGDLVLRLLKNDIPGLAKVAFPHVDVREVAFAHVSALTAKNSDGQRYILNEGSYWIEDTASILKDEFKKYGYKIPSLTVGKCIFSIAACFDESLQVVKPYYGRMMLYDNTKSRSELGVFYRSNVQTVLDTAYDFIRKGLVKNKLPKDHEISIYLEQEAAKNPQKEQGKNKKKK